MGEITGGELLARCLAVVHRSSPSTFQGQLDVFRPVVMMRFVEVYQGPMG